MHENKENYRRGRHVVYRLVAHVVLVTKYRRDPITDRVRELLIEVAREACDRHGATIMEADGEGDHLHLLVEFPPKVALSTLIGSIKTNTSRRVREQGWPEVDGKLWGDAFWSPSYFAETVGPTSLENVKAYIQNQRAPSRGPGRPAQVTQ